MNDAAFIQFDPKNEHLECCSEWNISNLTEIKKSFDKITLPKTGELILDGNDITKLDSAGAWFLTKYQKNLNIQYKNFTEQYKKLLNFAEEQKKPTEKVPVKKDLLWIQKLGKYSLQQATEFYEVLNYIGELFFEGLRTLVNPKFWCWNTICSIIRHLLLTYYYTIILYDWC